ncbi:MAG: IS256 family transposase [Candidatus Hydrogenedentes bacterium]|nr:IS256 family transposase [Candidatus Hydrogenedentota bacterium]
MATTSQSLVSQFKNQLLEDGDFLHAVAEVFLRELMEEEVQSHVGAARHERTSSRQGSRNGYKPRTLKTRVGELGLSVPQVRGMEPYHPSVFARYQRSERALLAACAEMYFMGVSTRKVASVLEKMGGFELSAGTVSRVAAELDEQLKTFRERRLDDRTWPYLLVDATYLKVRRHGRVQSTAMLVAVGIDQHGRREVLSWSPGDSESEETWSQLFRDLKARGLNGVELLVSDAHEGIRAAARRYLQGACWQRCRVHFMRNAMAKMGGSKDKAQVARELKELFVLSEKDLCRRAAEEMATRWESRCPALSQQLRAGFEDCLTVHDLPNRLRRRLHSTNMIERVMREIKRRTDAVSIFPNEASCDRLIGAHLMERQEKWLCESKRYLDLDGREQIKQPN